MGKNFYEYVETTYKPVEDFVIIGLTGRRGSGCSKTREILNEKAMVDSLIYQTRKCKDSLCDEIDFNTLKNFALAKKLFPFKVIRVRDIITTFILDNHGAFFEILKKVYKKENEKFDEIVDKFINDFVKKFEDELTIEEKKDKNIEDTFAAICNKSNKMWKKIEEDVYHYINTEMVGKDYMFLTEKISEISTFIHDFLKNELEDSAFTLTYQHIGNLIRKCGKVCEKFECDYDRINCKDSEQKSPNENIFNIIKRINFLIKIMRREDWILDINGKRQKSKEQESKEPEDKNNPLHLVIDSIKNVYEAYYMQARYGSFYLMGITVDDNIRKERLFKDKFDEDEIEYIDYREQSSSGEKVYKGEVQKEGKFKEYFDQRVRENNDFAIFLKKAFDVGDYRFYWQDVDYCIQNADILINNSGSTDELKKTLLRYVCLMVHPGIVLPTTDECNMQIAQTVKVNSGCISRQVGAVVCDKNGDVLSIGWNDPSAHDGIECFSCIRRNFGNYFDTHFERAYSYYEHNDDEFRKFIVETLGNNIDGKDKEKFEELRRLNKFRQMYKLFENSQRKNLNGLPCSYCFKNVYKSMKGGENQVHTRAQHGEEKALEGCNKSRTIGGTLYSTSSCCELCAKKALSYNIARIVYIEPYSGLTNDHILGHMVDEGLGQKIKRVDKDGNEVIRREQIRVELFTGATQGAYSKLYSPLFPLKDELRLRGIKIEDLKKDDNSSKTQEGQTCPPCDNQQHPESAAPGDSQ
jgi:deoxycytidylate deaminase